MYSMDIDKRPTSPVISSQLSANAQVDTWIKENDYTHMTDGNNQLWDVKIAHKELPDPNNAHKLLWEISVQLVAEPTAQNFIDTKVLDPVEDARLIDLMLDGATPLAMKPKFFFGNSQEELKQQLFVYLPELKQGIVRLDLKETKRKLIGRWVDESTKFHPSFL